ncbi:MAG: LysM peptidoglycan-binding domain-containing protein, partial [Clostridiales bacterium]|nr:LysM peptidoglycan-binding domain-containing protein [Clostridiales bacterium]
MKRKTIGLFLVLALVLSSFSFAFADQSYTVQPNDVLWKIAKKFDTTYQQLAEYNGIKNPNLIFPNQIIKIPDKSPAKPSEPVTGLPVADTVLKNGTVYTIDAANTVAQAVAIKGNEIIFVGGNADVDSYVGSSTKVVDLNGKVVMPGMIDSHVHRSGSALTELYDIYLYEDIDKESTLKTIKEFVDANPDLEVYWGAGFS